jgi:hypothetical protein
MAGIQIDYGKNRPFSELNHTVFARSQEFNRKPVFHYSKTELSEIDRELEPRLAWARTNMHAVEQLALDSTRLLSCAEDRLDQYKSQGFFKRCWSRLSGKHGELMSANMNDVIEMQTFGWRCLSLLNDRDILRAHSMITVKNNLLTLSVKDEELR